MKKITKNLLIVGLLIPTLSWANHITTATPVVAIVATTPTQTTARVMNATLKNPVKVIQTTIAQLNALTQTQYAPEAMRILVNQKIAPLFDFNHIAGEILFSNRLRLNRAEYQYFVKRLQKNVVTALLSKLNQADSTSFRFISAKPVYGRNIMVNLQVIGYSSLSLYIDLLFHQNEYEQWQIADVVLNNDSLINYYQRVVAIKIRRYGVHGVLSRI